MERRTVSLRKACELAGVSRRTIYNWIAAGKINYCRTAGGPIRVFEDELVIPQERAPDGRIGQNRLPVPARPLL